MATKKITKLCLTFCVSALMMVFITSFQASAAQVTNTNFETYFSNFDSSKWEYADWSNGDPFNCVWKPSQVTFSNGSMFLNLTNDNTGSAYPYKSGEYRTASNFGYGYYEVKMKATKNTGVVSSFFTYTGPSEGDPWDEIDIEFLGKDTTRVQFNWYKDGSGGNEYMHYLGFDASQDFHVYGFEWRQNFISYYVDGVKVYTGTRNIPVTPGKIMMNLWPGTGVDEWLGAYNGRTPLTAEYKYVKYYPNGVPSSQNTPRPTVQPTVRPTPTPIQSSAPVGNSNFETYFSNFDSSKWEYADWSNGDPFNCVWKPSQVTFSNGSMFLNLTNDNTGSSYPYKSGEYRTASTFGYGYYEVKMKATKNTGVVSSFFTYTGPSEGDPWDEIDIEFLGKDTTKVQFNWYKDGSGGNEYMHNLGFDASQDFHVYGFEWRQNFISYYVDGVKVYTGTRNIPVTPGKIMMNLWPGTGVDEWLGAYNGRTPLTAEYKYVKYYPNGVPSSQNTPQPTPTQSSGIVGDVNQDGSVNSIDFGYYRMYLLGKISDFPATNDLRAADLNGDGNINSLDFGYMQMYLLGKIYRFPAE